VKNRCLTVLSTMAILLCLAALSMPSPGLAQSNAMKDAVEQLAVDLHAGVDRSTLTQQQKEQLRDDFKELKRAHQNHERFAALRAARSIRATLDSGAFNPEDQQRIKQDLQTIREAREGRPGFGS